MKNGYTIIIDREPDYDIDVDDELTSKKRTNNKKLSVQTDNKK